MADGEDKRIREIQPYVKDGYNAVPGINQAIAAQGFNRTEASMWTDQLHHSESVAPAYAAAQPTMAGSSSLPDQWSFSDDYCPIPNTPRPYTEETMGTYDSRQGLQIWPMDTPEEALSASNSEAGVQYGSSEVIQQNLWNPAGGHHPADYAASSYVPAQPNVTGASTFPVPSSFSGGCCFMPSTSRAGIEETDLACEARMASASGGPSPMEEGNPCTVQPFECSVCHKVLASKESLQKHQARICGLKTWVCHQCGQQFVSKNAVGHHRPYCKPFKCAYCNKAFKEKVTLDSHVCPNAGRPLYECLKCGKKFLDHAGLKWHDKMKH
ncbi:hypothetical protein MTO96_016212 [Rhipicephalus appendiculatus]